MRERQTEREIEITEIDRKREQKRQQETDRNTLKDRVRETE